MADVAQVKDANNWIIAPPSAMPTPTAPFVGVPFPTLARGVLGTTFSVVGSPGKGGTVTFNYSSVGNDQTPSHVPVRVPLHIKDLGQPLLVPLQNVESFFWLEFVPDDTTNTFLALSCVHHLASPPSLIRFLSQAITDNEAVVGARSYLSAHKSDGTWPAVDFGQGLRAASLPTTLATEDLAALVAPATWSKTLLTGTGLPQTVKTGSGVLHAILSGSGTFIAYDDPGTGILNPFINLTGLNPGYIGPIDVAFTSGLRVVVQAAKLATVLYA